jgi:hypothetical protein
MVPDTTAAVVPLENAISTGAGIVEVGLGWGVELGAGVKVGGSGVGVLSAGGGVAVGSGVGVCRLGRLQPANRASRIARLVATAGFRETLFGNFVFIWNNLLIIINVDIARIVPRLSAGGL